MTEGSTEPMRCALIGADSLLIECGELLRARGHRIVSVAAGSSKVGEWARTQGVTVVDATIAGWVGALGAEPFDWLFAITHLAILPDEVLALPGRGSVNFHDGPLPAYAGLNAPAWALLNGEDQYGISWHEITSGIDEGDLLKQHLFDVASSETSLSINTRNFEVAIDSFGELVDELAAGTVVRTPQDLTAQRSVSKRNDRPPAMCVIDWRRPAVHIDRLVRALDFGPYANPLGSPTISANGHVVVVKRAELRDEGAECAPGEVIDVDGEILVATGDGAIALQAFETRAGAELAVDAVVAMLGLHPGATLTQLDDDRAERLTSLGQQVARSERFFNRRLAVIEPVELPWATTSAVDHVASYQSLPVSVDPAAIAVAGDLETAVLAGLGAVLARVSGKSRFHVALSGHHPPLGQDADALLSPQVPFEFIVDGAAGFAAAADAARDELASMRDRVGFLVDLVGRDPELRRLPELVAGRLAQVGVHIASGGSGDAPPVDGTALEVVVDGSSVSVRFDVGRVAPVDAARFVRCFEELLHGAGAAPSAPLAAIDLLGAAERARVLGQWNDTAVDFDRSACIHHLFEAQVDRSPDEVALVFEDRSLTYRALDERANQVAAHLVALGIGPDAMVGVYVERGLELMIAVLGVHKAGGGYVPLDPTYPSDRIEHMIRDSACPVIITMSHLESTLPLPEGSTANVVRLDGDAAVIGARSPARVPAAALAHHLAYCIYTSGSTGMPKGVLIEHRNAVNFFVGMDEVVAHELPATWFAVTSLSFDISVLELLYTVTRGFRVVIYLDHDKQVGGAGEPGPVSHAATPIDFSLFYFSGDEAENTGAGKYRLLLEGAKWADQHGFCAVWTPERHFHAFGGLYPQPAVTGAAVAAVTERVQIRAGSVVMPLHHPIRVAEAWSIVDNISNGRVGVSIASGWQPNDFVLMPENYADAKNVMFRDIEIVKRLWRGESVSFPGAKGGEVAVQTLPRPVQPELPVWVTTAGNPDTYVMAGSIGANVLTHLLGQSVEQLGPKLDLYRKARADHGFDPDAGIVSLMLHTYVGHDDETVREIVREPLKQYLGTSLSLLKEYAWAFPAFQKPGGVDTALDDDTLANLTDEEADAVLEFAFLRYYETSGLFGTPESCLAMVDALKGIGVNEIACLVDFGVGTETVLQSLPQLDVLRQASNAGVVPTPAVDGDDHQGQVVTGSAHIDHSAAAQIVRHGVTHLQCTPSMARMFSLHDDSRAALADVQHVYVGGEAFPVALAKDLMVNSASGNVTNMYGPTETTIWSTSWKLTGDLSSVPIGAPIANTKIYILDANLQLLPPGVPGDLWIGGEGVVRGYHERPELTADRFVADPFDSGARMYRTGDLAKWREMPDGSGLIDFLGRIDHQVKIRGYRIELGEIETRLGQHPDVRECVVVVREETAGDQQLVAFVSTRDGAEPTPSALKDHLRANLPDVMVPAHVVALADLPHTPNGKIDRNALPSLSAVLGRRAESAPIVAAENDLERTVLGVWQETLGTQQIGVDDNFFDIGGHSLLIVRMHRRLKEVLERPIALTELYRFPTIRGFSSAMSTDGPSAAMRESLDRAARRRENMAARRRPRR